MKIQDLERAKTIQFEIEKLEKYINICNSKSRYTWVILDNGTDNALICDDKDILTKIREFVLLENTLKLNQLKAEFESI